MYFRRLSFTLPLLLLLLPGAFRHVHACDEAKPPPERWNVTLDTSSLESVLLRPETIRDDPDHFWQTDPAYVLVKAWHERNDIPMDTRNYHQDWLAYLDEAAARSDEERKAHPAFRLLEDVQKLVPVFNDKSIALLNAFVPCNDLTFTTTIYVTGKTLPFAFMTDGMIVADALSRYYENDADRLFNILTHECFHIGYGYNRDRRTETAIDNDYVYNTMLDALQNEGMATYLGYRAQDFFPAKEDRDYVALDDPSEVRRQLGEINRLFESIASLPADSLKKRAWNVGVVERGYYVVGAHMSRTIDQVSGREALIGTVTTGPLGFVDTYNSLVEAEMRVSGLNLRERTD